MDDALDDEDEGPPQPALPLDHPKFRSVEIQVFTRRVVPDCMAHACTTVATHVQRNDVCCQYGCDVDLDEKARIDVRADAVRARMRDEVKNVDWFLPELYPDADYPSGAVVRTATHADACIFLAHDKRGCVLHRTALEEGWALGDIKPAICRLFPLSYETDSICVAMEYVEYSCAHQGGPTLYRITRDILAELFGHDLVVAMDKVEAQVEAMQAAEAAAAATAAPRRLPVVS